MSQYFIHNRTFFLQFYQLNQIILKFMPATGLKKGGMGQQRAEKARHFENIQMGEDLATN